MLSDPDDLLIDFGAKGNAAALCAGGWSTPEATETWTLGHESRTVLPRPALPATYVLVVRVRPLVSEKLRAQRLRVSVNKVLVAEFVIDRRAIRTCLIPWAAITFGPDVQITFNMPDAARPAEIGLNPDRRLLGLAFSTVLFYPDKHEVGQIDAFLSNDDEVPVDISLVMAAERMPLHDLMLQFESLGQNCEFGLVQRQCKAEPLGLLRFSSTPLPQLLEALDERFEGLGAPETTKVNLSTNGREYMVHDSRFGFVYHAWVSAGEMAPEDVSRRELRRVPFLVRKLVEDLEAGEKTFVFKGMGAMPEEEVFPLAMTIRRYGPNTLLLVTLSDEEHRGGTVEARAPGFLVGYVDRFAPGDNAHDLLIEQWVKVCREAYRLRLAAGSAKTK
jgi:hypothetical protein